MLNMKNECLENGMNIEIIVHGVSYSEILIRVWAGGNISSNLTQSLNAKKEKTRFLCIELYTNT